MGLAIVAEKTFFLFWDVKDIGKTFNSDYKKVWHPFLQEHDVREWDKEKKEKKGKIFKEGNWQKIDKQGEGLSGHLECILKGFLPDKKCDFKNLMEKGVDKVYISCQIQNKKAEEIIIDILSKKYNLYPILPLDISTTNPICFKCAAIHASKFQIIDVSAHKKGDKGESDDTQRIGRRYRRQDELGTPYCVTVDQSDPVEM